MFGYVFVRIASSILLFFAITLFVFIAFFALPKQDFGRRGQISNEYTIHGPVLGEYAHYVWRIIGHGDFGRSYGNRESVTTRLFRAAPVTLSLVLGGLVVWLMISIPLGLLAALRPRSKLDRGATIFVLLGLSVHPVWLGLMLSWLVRHELNVLPAQGYCSFNNLSTGFDGLGRWASHLLMPWVVFGLVNAALFTLMVRSLVLEELEEEYVRTARAKGAGERRIVMSHLLRNVTLPLVTMFGVLAATSLAGVIFIETAFDLPGLGGLLRQAATRRDLPLTAGSVIFFAVVIMLINLLVDLSYAVLDPRTRRAWREA